MYVTGVSTRKVARITKELCGFEVSSAQVSRLSAELDEVLEAWCNRPLGECRYLHLDARYEKVRADGGYVMRRFSRLAAFFRTEGALCWGCPYPCRSMRCTGGIFCSLWSNGVFAEWS